MAQVVFFKSDNTGCGYYRSDLPAKILLKNSIPSEVRFIKPTFRAYPQTQIVFVQRHYIFIDVPILLRKFKKNGLRIVYDLDDDFFNLTPEINLHRIKDNLLKEIKELASFADVMTVSTIRLKELCKQIYSGEIRVIPNMIDLDLWKMNQLKNDQRLRIGWAGSPTHNQDLLQLLPVFKKILKRYEFVDLIFFGFCPKPFFELGERVLFVKGGSYEHFASELPQLGLDIGVIPILENEFNRSKSIVKFLEYSAIGLPSIVSNSAPYNIVVKDNYTGLLARDSKEWFYKLSELIENPEKRFEIGKNSRKEVLKYGTETLGHLWLDLFNNLLITSK